MAAREKKGLITKTRTQTRKNLHFERKAAQEQKNKKKSENKLPFQANNVNELKCYGHDA